jgi:DNA-binding NtrC family response regulator
MAQILIIDDNDDMREILTEILQRKGYEVSAASDGEEGMRMFRQDPTDLVITDIIMPKKEGVETIFDLQSEFPAVKIIAISGGGVLKSTECLKMIENIPSVKRTMKKPFSNDELLQAVKELIG